MKNDKLLIIFAIVVFSFGVLQTTATIASAKDVDEEMSPYKWGHWSKMVPPAAGPIEIAPPVVAASIPDTPDPAPPSVVPPEIDVPPTDYGSSQPPLNTDAPNNMDSGQPIL